MTDDELDRALLALPLAEPPALLWLAVGISAVWWISNPTLMLAPRVAVTKRS